MNKDSHNIPNLPPYTVAIRTLGKGGEKYQRCLDSLMRQTHRPQAINIYLAEGFDKPEESVGFETIKVVPKGMVAQRALDYEDVSTEWILFSDDDVEFGRESVADMFRKLEQNHAQVIAPDIIPHNKLPILPRVAMAILGGAVPRFLSPKKGYTVNCTGSYSYNPNAKGGVRESTTNAGACFLCRKSDFLKINFKDDLWLDDVPYAIPDDMVMYFKMHLKGLKILTQYSPDIYHLDARTSMSSERDIKNTYSLARNKYIFYHLYVLPNLSASKRLISRMLRGYQHLMGFVYTSILRRDNKVRIALRNGIADAKNYLITCKHI